MGEVQALPEPPVDVPVESVERARSTFAAYREVVRQIAGDPLEGEPPKDPSFLSWTLAACSPLPLGERQQAAGGHRHRRAAGAGHRPAPRGACGRST
ncbi:hypothetical protein [Nocardioides convexus]|uniref:hypothetical protein n=1 Tax=Nocardioides convexus TaxID=2712224 RepID=UPI0024184CDF|nr:hypothetical protein [Nocardioides convexus]